MAAWEGLITVSCNNKLICYHDISVKVKSGGGEQR